jgi:hypothetical protein
MIIPCSQISITYLPLPFPEKFSKVLSGLGLSLVWEEIMLNFDKPGGKVLIILPLYVGRAFNSAGFFF